MTVTASVSAGLRLTAAIKPLVQGKRVRLITSSAPRAVDSALELMPVLGVSDFEAFGALWSDNRHHENYDAALALLAEKRRGVDVLIMVTHLEYAKYLPRYFSESINTKHRVESNELWKGGCRVLTVDGDRVSKDEYLPSG